MKLSDDEIQKILEIVKKEPQTVFDISKKINRSWVTTEKYLHEIKEKTGLINLKTFREGSQGALKIVYSTSNEWSFDDEIRTNLAHQILHARQKKDFDFMDIFQFIKESEKSSYVQKGIKPRSRMNEPDNQHVAQKTAHVFSGNLSYLTNPHKGKTVVELMEEELENGAHIRILTRVNTSTLQNIEKISNLLVKYPGKLEIHHRYQPLRGVIIDEQYARFRGEEQEEDYREGELPVSERIYYEIHSPEWIAWLEKVFWQMWRSSIPFDQRIKEIQKIAN